MKLGWLCKHSGEIGTITLPEDEANIGEVVEQIKTSHSQQCKIRGQVWILIDSERRGTIRGIDGETIESVIENPEEGQLFLCLHIQ